jgi:TIR domain/YEATS family
MIPIETNLRLQNDSHAQNDNWWDWSVWVEGPEVELANIEVVTYRLDPTFSNPMQPVQDRSTGFRLKGAGWGEFAIKADVKFKEGRTTRLERWLEFRDGPKKAGSELSPAEQKPTVFVSHSITDNKIVQKIRAKLEGQGLRVLTDQDIGPDTDWEEEIRRQLKSADVVIPIVSDPPSNFVEEEAQLAQSNGRIVLPIVVGNATLPKSFGNIVFFQFRETKNIAGLANHVAAKVKDLVFTEDK